MHYIWQYHGAQSLTSAESFQGSLDVTTYAVNVTAQLCAAGEVAIDLQRVGNHCKDIAAELHKVKADMKDGSFPSTVLQLKQQNASLADQLQQTAARCELKPQ